ncbi:metal ABC transporter permease [Luteococcus sp. H138]|uniref:metal ABC transporter permease n=1 Tax=unclassified Luteococcus TaxID=2639923 RepID=UPI00313E1768
MNELFGVAFMQRALIAAFLSGLMSPAIGTYIVQRRLSLLGDGLGHVAVAGVGLSFLTGTAPLPLAIAVCVAGAVAVELLRQQGRATGDVGLAVLFYGGLASGVMMAGLGGQGTGALSQFLFGSLTTVSESDLVVVSILASVVLLFCVGLWPRLFAICADEDFSQVLGLKVRWLNLLIVVLAAVTVTMSMRTVGLLLVSAMMVIPVATAQNLFVSFKACLFGSMAIGASVAFGGTVGSYFWNTASGATIVVCAIALFLATWPFTAILHRRHATWAAKHELVVPVEHVICAEPPHSHDGDHVAIQHGDHVDYLHDGHRHAPHGDHFDEH